MSDGESSIAFAAENHSEEHTRQSSAAMYPVEEPNTVGSALDSGRTPVFHVEAQGPQVSPPQWAVNPNDSVSFQLESPGTQSLEFVSAPRSAARSVQSPQAGAGAAAVHESIDFHIEPPRGRTDSVVFQVASGPSSAPLTAQSPELHELAAPPAEAEETTEVTSDDDELSTNDVAPTPHHATATRETEEVASLPSSSELSTPRDGEVPTAAAPMQNAQPTSHGTSSVQFLSVQSSAQEAALQPATAVVREASPGAPPPPSRLSRRAETLTREHATTPRASTALPKTPRTRSAGSSWVPRHQPTPSTSSATSSASSHDAEEPHVAPAAAEAGEYPTEASSVPTSPATSPTSDATDVPVAAASKPTAVARPPLAPSSGAPAAAPAPPTQPVRYARAQSASSEFSAFDEGSNSELGSIPRSERGQAPPGSTPMQAIVVTDHAVAVQGDQWANILKASPDAVERALVSDTAEAVGVETAFINVLHVAADEEGAPGLSAAVKIAHDANVPATVVDAKLAGSAFTQTHLLYSLSTGEEAPASAPAAATRAIGRAPSVDSDADSESIEPPVEEEALPKSASAHTESDADEGDVVFEEEPAPAAVEEPVPVAPQAVDDDATTPKKTKKAKSKSKSPSKAKKSKKAKSKSPEKKAKKGKKATKTAGKKRKSVSSAAKSPTSPANRAASKPPTGRRGESCAPAYTPYQERELPRELTTPRTYTPRTPRAGAGADASVRFSSRGPRPFTDAASTRRSSSVATRESMAHSVTSRRASTVHTAAGGASVVPPQVVQRAVRPVTPRAAYRSQARPLMDASGNANARAVAAPRQSTSTASPRHPSAQPREHSPEQIRDDQGVTAEIHARQLLQQLRVHNESVQRSQARTLRDGDASQPTAQPTITTACGSAVESSYDANSPGRGRETHSVSRRSHSRNQSPTRTGGRGGSPGASPLPRASGYPIEDSANMSEMAPEGEAIAVA